jgi:hypothetical protein
MKQMKDGSAVQDPRLGRLIDFDERSRLFAFPQPEDVTLKDKTWLLPKANRLNQKLDGTCVGHGFAHEIASDPVALRRYGNHDYALSIFDAAARNDGWEGHSRADGTSVLAAAKVCVRRGFYLNYRWAFTIDQLLAALITDGPVVVGTWWTDHMDSVTPGGYMASTEGSDLGGHCYLIRGVKLKPRLTGHSNLPPCLRLTNSWGLGWGLNGEALVPIDEFERLVKREGEMCIPTGRKRP